MIGMAGLRANRETDKYRQILGMGGFKIDNTEAIFEAQIYQTTLVLYGKRSMVWLLLRLGKCLKIISPCSF